MQEGEMNSSAEEHQVIKVYHRDKNGLRLINHQAAAGEEDEDKEAHVLGGPLRHKYEGNTGGSGRLIAEQNAGNEICQVCVGGTQLNSDASGNGACPGGCTNGVIIQNQPGLELQ